MELEAPHVALARLHAELTPVPAETLPLADAAGRVLAETIHADRDSPPFDASAMDGVALRLDDLLQQHSLPLAGESAIGQAAPPLPTGTAVRISTGSAVPAAADTVIKIEDLQLADGTLRLRPGAPTPQVGQFIRCRGENTAAGQAVAHLGRPLNAAAVAAAAGFGVESVRVHRPVRLAVLVTGNEVRHDRPAEPTDICDSNGPLLRAAAARLPTVRLTELAHVGDDLQHTVTQLDRLRADADLVVTTGGVSMGQHDHVPAAAARLGARRVYHRLAMRPGKPNFAALAPDGTPILGLPGNPVSVLCGWCRLVRPTLAALAGLAPPPAPPRVDIARPDRQTLHLWWYRPGRLDDAGRFVLQPNRGSGDIAALGSTQGFLEQPPHRPHAAGRYYAVD
jgi:molybdopterin molybdotransferase